MNVKQETNWRPQVGVNFIIQSDQMRGHFARLFFFFSWDSLIVSRTYLCLLSLADKADARFYLLLRIRSISNIAASAVHKGRRDGKRWAPCPLRPTASRLFSPSPIQSIS